MLTNRLAFRRIFSWIAETRAHLSGGPKQIQDPAVISDDFIFSSAPHAMSHASTIAASGGRLVAAWFGGSLESRPDVGILVSLNTGSGWSVPVEIANGKQPDGSRFACWNPVLFQPSSGPLLLFYKVGSNPRTWWGMCTESSDNGKTWSTPKRLADGILGPIKNKPVQLANGELLSPSSTESGNWRIQIERSTNQGRSWALTGLSGNGGSIAAIQPSILIHTDGYLQLMCRTPHKRIAESWSIDDGKSWSELELTTLKNPNSGTDAVSLADGRQLLVYNRSSRRRTPLNIALSLDGRTWHDSLVLETGIGEYSYPAVIQTDDGLIHITYSWNLSRIRHVVIDPEKLRHSRLSG
jgi:predicted neuraminidase